jgi:hypothetical protein
MTKTAQSQDYRHHRGWTFVDLGHFPLIRCQFKGNFGIITGNRMMLLAAVFQLLRELACLEEVGSCARCTL